MKIGKNVRIRAIEKEDLGQIAQWMSDPAVNGSIATAAMMSLAAEQRWFESTLSSKSDEVFMVDRLHPVGDGESPWEIVGGAGLHRISSQHGSCSFGIYIGEPKLWGKGLGTEAAALVLDYGFGELRLHRIELEVFTDNARARRSYEKLGFVEEGIRRQAFFRHGAYKDAVLMSMLAPDWISRRDLRNHTFVDDKSG